MGLALLLVPALLSAVVLARSQAGNRAELQERFAARTSLAATFVATYSAERLEREHLAALSTLSRDTAAFDTLVASFGMDSALLLDRDGRVLRTAPSRPELYGKPLTGSFPHLTAALAGQRAVSPVVESAVTGEPIVGFAVPFETPGGRRVFSGAYTPSATPLRAFLNAVTSLQGARVYLVDRSGHVLTSSGDPVAGQMSSHDPALARAALQASAGEVDSRFYAAAPVAGTPWTVITSVPSGVLLAPVSGAATYVPWIVLALLILVAITLFGVAHRLLDSRARLAAANRRLDRLAHVDALTGVQNRRSASEQVARMHAEAQAAQQPLAVLMIDIDHFKRINDTLGHSAGDHVLVEVAARLTHGLRAEDVLGRWGGEEFVVFLPNTDADTAQTVSERLRASVADRTISVGTGGDDVTVTVSIGTTSSTSAPPDALLFAADRALYTAKDEGRNAVRARAC